jgi:hypothetical protein
LAYSILFNEFANAINVCESRFPTNKEIIMLLSQKRRLLCLNLEEILFETLLSFEREKN